MSRFQFFLFRDTDTSTPFCKRVNKSQKEKRNSMVAKFKKLKEKKIQFIGGIKTNKQTNKTQNKTNSPEQCLLNCVFEKYNLLGSRGRTEKRKILKLRIQSPRFRRCL